MDYDIKVISRLARERFELDAGGIHGVKHWQRVQENGLRIASSSGANRDVVMLFATLHDCCRENDGHDLEHGPRAADFVRSLVGYELRGNDDEIDTLLMAIRDHTSQIYTEDATLGTCWDADRLDIGRVGFLPDRKYLNSCLGKTETVIQWAYRRSREV